ncbi:LysR family transcriptional regulator [Vibrio agarivorans]|uniref:LysR family transcriptional regulator n=1 Tax=Vibrio agarivorans TaxID=153622 RepID=UPI0025B54AC8|nr:LysR family transcriptional regulator [Vibrio agarivorans]MDN3660018.1 LysR family transcriptional regulator [Vibrio agarivorans]
MDNLDLKAIRVLLNLSHTCNTYQTAEQLDLSQSAVARMLAKCRTSFNDPLFIRNGNQLSPTAFMEVLQEKLPNLIDSLEGIVAMNREFNPQDLTGTYQVFLNSKILHMFGSALYNQLEAEAPNATWYLKGWESNSSHALLNDNAVWGINYYSEDLANSIVQEPVWEDEIVILANADHPIHAIDNIEIEHLATYPFASLSIPSLDEKNRYLEDAMRKFGLKPNVKIQTDSIILALEVTQKKGLLLPCSREYAKNNLSNLKVVNCKTKNIEIPVAQVVCTYARKNANKPMVKWLKKLTHQLASTIN